MSERDKAEDSTNIRRAKKVLFISNNVLIPHWLQTVNDSTFRLEAVNCIRPKFRNAFDDSMCTVYDSAMGTVIDGELEGRGVSDRPILYRIRILILLWVNSDPVSLGHIGQSIVPLLQYDTRRPSNHRI